MRTVWAPAPEAMVELWLLEEWLRRVRMLALRSMAREPYWSMAVLCRATRTVRRARRRGAGTESELVRLERIADVLEAA